MFGKQGRWFYKDKYAGSVTVFAAMSFMLVVSVVCVLIEGARCQGARAMVAMSAEMALDSMFSGFERELLDKYGVLLFDGADGKDTVDVNYISDTLRKKISDSLDMDSNLIFTKGTDFYDIEIADVNVTGVLTAADAFGLIWRKSVNDYAKINYTVELLESLLGIGKVEEESKTVKAASDVLDGCMEQISDFYKKYLRLIEHVDGIKTGSNGVNFDKLESMDIYVKSIGPGGSTDITQDSMSISDYRVYQMAERNLVDIYSFRDIFLGKFMSAIEGKDEDVKNVKELGLVTRKFFRNLKGEIEDSIKLIDDMRGDRELISEKISSAAEYISSLSQLSELSLAGIRESFNMVEKEQEKVLKRLGDADAMYEVLQNNLEVINKAYNSCADMSSIRDDGVNIHQAGFIYEEYKEAFEMLADYRTDSMWLDYADVACTDENKSILGCIYDYTLNGMLALVLPSDEKVSEKKIGNMGLADAYGIRGNRGEYIEDAATDFMNEMLFNVYIADCFDNYIDNDGEGIIDYEQEYIMFGKNTDRDNLKAAAAAISAVRLGCNMTYILADTQKKSEAYAVALAALGFTGIIALVTALQYVILTAWALGETVVDMRMILSGKKVPVLKKKGEWKLELENLIAGMLDVTGDDDGDGLDYGQYLTAVMLLGNAQDKAFRSMAAAEMHMISQGMNNFRMKNYIYGLDISVSYYMGDKKTKYTYQCSYTY